MSEILEPKPYDPGQTSEERMNIIKSLYPKDMELDEETVKPEPEPEPKPKCVKQFPRRPLVELAVNPHAHVATPHKPFHRFVFTAVSFNNDGNHHSSVSIVTLGGDDIILGMTTVDKMLKATDVENPIVDHLQRIRRIPGCEHAAIVLSVENNMRSEATHVIQLVERHFENVIIMKDSTDDKPGFLVTQSKKEDMFKLTLYMLETESRPSMHENIVCADTSNGVASTLVEFVDQMLRFSRTELSNDRVVFTQNAKLANAYMQCLYARRDFYCNRSRKYNHYFE